MSLRPGHSSSSNRGPISIPEGTKCAAAKCRLCQVESLQYHIGGALKRLGVGVLVAVMVLWSEGARADTFAAGSLIVPMDTTYQDNGMLKAFGLVYELLRNDVPVQWVIRRGKAHLGVAFTASAVDHKTRAPITSYGYRGGPWVINATDAARAIPIINAWQTANPAVAVHEVSAPFAGDVARYLIVAPTIAMHQD